MLSLFSERDTWPKLPDDVYRAVSGRYLWTEPEDFRDGPTGR